MRTFRRRFVAVLWVAALMELSMLAAPRPALAIGNPLLTAATAHPASAAPPQQSNPDDPTHKTVLDAFGHTRLFQLAEGKQTTSLHEMLQPAFWLDTIKELIVAAVSFIPRLLVSVLFLFVFWLIYRALRRVMLGAMAKAHVDNSIRDLLVTCLKWTVMGFGVVIACNQIGIPIVAMLTGVSILGLAVGFAAQETLANFIAGVVIFWDKPFRVGDWLTVEGTFARVMRITFRSCRLLDQDGEIVIFPNTNMLAKRVANHSAHPLSRISVTVPLLDAPIGPARRGLLATTIGDARVRHTPRPEVVLGECTKENTPVVLRFWIEDVSLEQSIAAEYREKAKAAVEEAAKAAAAAAAAVPATTLKAA
jgi:small conductance mechanosensitive channel